jgi:hypothetical protein
MARQRTGWKEGRPDPGKRRWPEEVSIERVETERIGETPAGQLQQSEWQQMRRPGEKQPAWEAPTVADAVVVVAERAVRST